MFNDVIEIPSYCNLIVGTVSDKFQFGYSCNPEPSKHYKSIALEFHINNEKLIDTFGMSPQMQELQEESHEQYTHYFGKVILSYKDEWASDFNLFCDVSICLQIVSSQTDTSELVKSIKLQLFK